MSRSFTERHARRGIVSNQDRNDTTWGRTAPFASVSCCGRSECVAKATAYVAAQTNQTAIYQADKD